MRTFPKRTPLILLALLGGGWIIFLLNAFFPVPVETVFAMVGMSVFLVGMAGCVIAVIWAFRSLASREGRQTSGIVAPVATILIGFVVWSGVIGSAVAVKRSLDARDDPHPAAGHTEETKYGPNTPSHVMAGGPALPTFQERDFEIMEHVLRQWPHPKTDRVYYLTTTPMDQWGETGNWQDLPDSFHKRIADLPVVFHKASEAQLVNHSVIDRKTGNPGWMQWVAIKRWLSDTEVEVEFGVWTAPLGGGAQTIIWQKVGDCWKIKQSGRGWVS